jgi:MFS superfamily sulfate permease-like transporter
MAALRQRVSPRDRPDSGDTTLPNRFRPFRPRLLDVLQGYNRQRFLTDLGAGITVGIAALPLTLAFGIASGVKPEQGLITAVIAGFLISALGGSQVQIGGPAGAFIAIVYGIIDRYGFTNLLVSTVMAGMLMFVLGLLKLGVLIRCTPVSIGIGFTNGSAVLIALSQLRDLMGLAITKLPGEFFAQQAAVAGILLFVAWNMFEGHQFSRLRQFSVPYRTLMLGTFVRTIVFDLTVAVEVRLVLACVFFIWRMSTLFSMKPHTENDLPPGVAAFELYGALFFGAVGKIETLPEQLPPNTRAVVLDMQRLISMDTSGLDALEQMQRTLHRQDIALVLANVNPQPLSLIRRSGFEAVIGAENIVPNIAAAVQGEPDDPILP